MQLTTRSLKWLAVVLPVSFLLGVLYLRLSLVPPERALEGNIYALLATALGAVIFSIFIFNIIETREELIRQRSLQLEALHEAALALTHELELESVLQKVVDLSRELLDARYGALGVLESDSNMIAQFITSGISDEQRARIGAPPRGHGLLGVISYDGEPLMVADIDKDPRSAGFPPNHPPMKSLLGVPIKSKGEIFGNLYLADKVSLVDDGESEELTNFLDADRQLLEKFATQAAIAIENAQLYAQIRELAVLKERERFSMDLHDGIMQSVYATGLSLQHAERRLDQEPQEARGQIQQATEQLGQVLQDIRNYIMGLRPDRFRDLDLSAGIREMARELHANTLLNVEFESSIDQELSLSESKIADLLHIVQEALANVRKHARASNVWLRLHRQNGKTVLEIEDDGVGFKSDEVDGSGHGLDNMRERAKALGAQIDITGQGERGTHIALHIPQDL